ncbi:transcription and mRNA export factor ENY2 [Fagus crenata]
MKGVLIVGAWSRAELLIFVCTCREAYVRLCPHPTTGNDFAPFRFLLTIVVSSRRPSVNRPPTPDVQENQEKEPTLQETINIKQLIESGEKERLMELLRERLVECGWKDEMKAHCRAVIKKKGRNNVTVDDLVHAITPMGRGKDFYCSFLRFLFFQSVIIYREAT